MAPPDSSVSAEPIVTCSSGRAGSSRPDVRLVHYNDVYHLDPSSAEPVGGIARFISLCNEYRDAEQYKGQPELLTLFSGDVFNPSLESTITKGSHMVPFLNNIGTDCACVGNHDLDFGVVQFENLTSKCNFPWLLANVLDPALGDGIPLGHAKKTHIITTSNGIKIGIIGLGEREWLDTINALPPDLIYRSATEVALELIPELRKQGCEVIIALTHQREPNDLKLAEQTGGQLDLILGGHDHFYSHQVASTGTHVLRSGADFKQLSYIELRKGSGKWAIDIWRRDIVSSIPEDVPSQALVDKLTARLKKSLERPVGWTAAPLDARFTTVRTRESNIGNLVCDIMRHHYGADCALMAAGTIRGDQIYPPGPIRVKDITDCFPFEDPVVVIKVSGKGIWDALENSVSLYPALEGRFPQVSNIVFTFDPSRKPGSRVVSASIGGSPIDPTHEYILATRGYMARGKDGYTSLLGQSAGGTCEELVSEENGILISMMLRQYFLALKIMDQWKGWCGNMQRHWNKVVEHCAECHPVVVSKSKSVPTTPGVDKGDPTPGGHGRKSSWSEWTPAKLRRRRSSIAPLSEHAEDSDSEESPYDEVGGNGDKENRQLEKELQIMRRVFRKWARLAGVKSRVCDSLTEDEFEIDWTKAIAPRVEGRITMVGEGVVRAYTT